MVELLEHEKRPWGSFSVLARTPTYVVKELRINPQTKLSYQAHMHRQELWLAISGTGLAILDGFEVPIISGLNLPIMVHQQMKHRIINDTDEELVIVEIWTGEDLREDDIIRFEDDYGRA